LAYAAADAQSLPHVQAVMSVPIDAPLDRPILLDASQSRLLGSDARFLWFVSGRSDPISMTADAVYTPRTPGVLKFRLVVSAQVGGERQESQAVQEVTVYRRKVVLLAGADIPREKVDAHVGASSGSGLFLKVIRTPMSPSDAEAFERFLFQQRDTFRGAQSLILWTDTLSALQSLTQAMQADQSTLADIRNQSIVLVTDNRLAALAQMARVPYAALQPQRIVLIHPDVLDTLLLAPDVAAFVSSAQARDLSISVLDASTPPVVPWQVLSLLVNYMLLHGVSSQTILLLLMLPVIATILSFLKQVVGVTTFGLFIPSIIALSFLVLGWLTGLLFFLFILVVGYVSRALVLRLHILYVPKMAIIITLVSVSLLVLLALNLLVGVVVSRETVFVLLIMSTLAESFLTTKSEQGWTSAILAIAQTVVAALLCVFVVQWPSLQTLVLAYPELILFTIVINIIVGRYTGLRLTEYFRFREVFRHMARE
jgi:hypothetical protein